MVAFAKRHLTPILVVALLGVAAAFAWQRFQPQGLPAGFTGSNGRVEAVEIDIATKTAGRVEDILVNEGDLVRAGDVLARMDTAVLKAQLREAQAQLQRAIIGIETVQSQVKQREAELEAAQAVVLQRNAERDAAQKQLTRTRELATKGTATLQSLDEDLARHEGAKAAVSAAQAQVAAAEAARGFARSQVFSWFAWSSISAGNDLDSVLLSKYCPVRFADSGALARKMDVRAAFSGEPPRWISLKIG